MLDKNVGPVLVWSAKFVCLVQYAASGLSGGLSKSYMPKGYLEVTTADFFYETLQKKDSERCMFIV